MIGGQERATILRRSFRVAGAASAGFYPLLYGAGLPVTALYALFAPIALGLLPAVPDRLPGAAARPRERTPYARPPRLRG